MVEHDVLAHALRAVECLNAVVRRRRKRVARGHRHGPARAATGPAARAIVFDRDGQPGVILHVDRGADALPVEKDGPVRRTGGAPDPAHKRIARRDRRRGRRRSRDTGRWRQEQQRHYG